MCNFKLLSILVLSFASAMAFAARDVAGASVSQVYQWDSDGIAFDFEASVPHSCGSSLYRVTSPNQVVSDRKFTLILTAFAAGKKIAFHDTGVCDGTRSLASWVRITD